jgi:hypothetical protein
MVSRRALVSHTIVLEHLEQRTLMATVPIGMETPVSPVIPVPAATLPEVKTAVAGDSAGDFVIAWTAPRGAGSEMGVFARCFDASGSPLSSTFSVDSSAGGDDANPTVAMDAAGGFVVAWQASGRDGDGLGVFARAFDPTGTPRGDTFQVNAYTKGDQSSPAVATDAAGDFVVAWQSAGQDGDGLGIFAQRYDADGRAQVTNPDGSPRDLQVNSITKGDQSSPAVAMDAAGDFVVAWVSGGLQLYAQRYDANGVALVTNPDGSPSDLPIDPTSQRDETNPAVAMDAAGDFVVTWLDGRRDLPYPEESIFARRFGSDGTSRGDAFLVDPSIPGDQSRPAVAMGANGTFSIAWEGLNQANAGLDVFLQPFDASGMSEGSEVLVNTTTFGDQFAPAVASAGGNDAVVVAWAGFGAGDLDTTGPGTVAFRRFAATTGADDFGDSLDTAQTLTLSDLGSGSQAGAIEAPRDVDAFRFQATVTGRMTVRLGATAGDALGAGLSAFDATGEPIVPVNTDTGVDKTFLSFDVRVGVDYAVEVAGRPGAVGPYLLTIATNPDGAPADGLPVPLSPEGFGSVLGTIATSSEVNNYKFIAQQSGLMTIRESATAGSSLDGFLYVLDDRQALIASDDNSGGGLDALVHLRVDVGRTYVVQVAGLAATIGAYTLAFGPKEVGSSFDDAAPLTLGPPGAGAPTELSGAIAVPGDDDMYRFVAPASGTLTIMSQAQPGEFDPLVAAYDSARRLINVNLHALTIALTQGETYYLRVSDSDRPAPAFPLTGRFLLDLSLSDSGLGAGQDFDGASTVDLDVSGAGSASGKTTSDPQTDFYQFTATRTGLFQVRADAFQDANSFFGLFGLGGAIPVLRIFDGMHTPIATVSSRPLFNFFSLLPISSFVAIAEFPVIAGESYFVQVAATLGADGPYKLQFETLTDPYSGDFADAQEIPVTPGHTDVPNLLGQDGHGSQEGLIATPGAVEFFTFTAPTTGQMTIRQEADPGHRALDSPATIQGLFEDFFLRGAGAQLDSFLTVYDANQQLITFNDNGGGGLDSLVRFNVVAGRTYYVRAAGVGASVGSYDLLFDTGAPVHPQGNSFDDAIPVAPGADDVTLQTGTIQVPADVVMYQFTAPMTGLMTIRQEASPGGRLDSELFIYDAARNPIAANNDSEGTLDSLVQFPVVAGQTYYVRAAANGTTTGPFVLSFASRPGDTFSDATPIPLDATGAGVQQGTIAVSGQKNFYVFTAPVSGLITIEQDADPNASAQGPGLDSVLTAFDDSSLHAVIAADDDIVPGSDLNSRIQFRVVAGATYFLQAAGHARSTGGYRLTFFTLPESYADAPTIALSRAGTGSRDGAIASPGAVDLSQFVAPRTGLLTVHLQAGAGSTLIPTITALDSSLQLVAADDNPEGMPSSLIQFTVVAGQTYFLRAAGAGASTGAYTLDLFEAQALALNGLGAAGLAGAILAASDVDTYQFTATRSGVLSVRQTAGDLDAVLYAFDSTQSLITFDGGGGAGVGGPALQFEVTAGQTYFLRVAGFGGGTGRFTLKLTTTTGDGYGSTFDNATPLLLDPSGTILAPSSQGPSLSGSVEAPGSVDLFQFQAPLTGQLTVTESAIAGSGLDPYLVVYDDAHQEITRNDDDGPGTLASLVAFHVQVGRTYYLQAGGYGLSTGDYTLQFTPTAAVIDDTSDYSTARPLAVALPTASSTFTQAGTIISGAGSQLGAVGVPGTEDLYQFASPLTGRLRIALGPAPGSPLLGALRAYTSLQGTPTQIAHDDPGTPGDAAASGSTPEVTIDVVQGQVYYIRVAAATGATPEQDHGGYVLTIQPGGEEAPSLAKLDQRVGAAVAGDLTLAYTANVDDPQTVAQAAGAINQSLRSTLLAAIADQAAAPTTDYLVLWLDPVNFNLTDPQYRQVGYTADRGQVVEVDNAFFSRPGNASLQLLIIPGVQLDASYRLELVGVGAHSVLIGAEVVTQDGGVALGEFNLITSATPTIVAAGSLATGDLPKSSQGELVAYLDFRTSPAGPSEPGSSGLVPESLAAAPPVPGASPTGPEVVAPPGPVPGPVEAAPPPVPVSSTILPPTPAIQLQATATIGLIIAPFVPSPGATNSSLLSPAAALPQARDDAATAGNAVVSVLLRLPVAPVASPSYAAGSAIEPPVAEQPQNPLERGTATEPGIPLKELGPAGPPAVAAGWRGVIQDVLRGYQTGSLLGSVIKMIKALTSAGAARAVLPSPPRSASPAAPGAGEAERTGVGDEASRADPPDADASPLLVAILGAGSWTVAWKDRLITTGAAPRRRRAWSRTSTRNPPFDPDTALTKEFEP